MWFQWKEGVLLPGEWYLLEFSGGDRFVVVRTFYEYDEDIKQMVFRMEDQNNYGYVSDCVDVIVAYMKIPAPLQRG